MLIRDFYAIEEFSTSENKVQALIRLNPEHEVYKGHFPGQPVLPGVIQLQIVKEIMEKAVIQKLLLSEMVFAKYLKMITPDKSQVLSLIIDFSIKENSYKFSAAIKDEGSIYLNVKGVFMMVINTVV